MTSSIISGSADESSFSIGIAVARWNSYITDKLLQGALNTLQEKGYSDDQLTVARCPGAFEIPFTAQQLLPYVDGVITLGAVIQGETPHFDYVCKAATDGVMQLNLKHNKPVVFGVLTTSTAQQAAQRADADSKFGNKGTEAALALIEMLSLAGKLGK